MSRFLAYFEWGRDLLPQGSGMAKRVDSLIWGLLVVGTVVIVTLGALTAYILIRYRRGSVANRAAVGIATWKIETAWTVVTLAVFLYFFVRGASVYMDMERTPPNAEVIHVVARQWMWDIRYEDGRREFNALHLRQYSPVGLVLSSEDVIHSFFVPAFRMKQDVVPGKLTTAWVTPTRTGTYTLFCAQYCGTAHAEMTGTICVLSPAEFDRWKRGSEAGGATAGALRLERGRAVYAHYGCGRCHEDPDERRAPSLVGLFGVPVRLEGGRAIRADEQYLHDAILHSPKFVVAGYPPSMPTYADIISEPEAMDLVSYIESLRSPNAPLASLK
jgi:cytochrome c oxidase subunit 2